jgi:hypothetical protein
VAVMEKFLFNKWMGPKCTKHPSAHHPLDAHYDSVVDESQRINIWLHLGNPFYNE